MPNGEPIGVAFVEVRPEVEDFQGQAEADLTSALGEQSIAVRGDFKLDGVDAARADIDALTQQAHDAVAELAVQTSPEFARGFVEGAEEAVQAAVEFSDATEQANQGVISAEAARLALADANLTAAITEEQLAASMDRQAKALYEADAATRQLLRTRARRAGSLGPLRLAGIGVGAGVALFAATQALRELGNQLQVTGNEATTATGKLRNVGASLLSGDVVGAFKAAVNQTKEYSTAQVGAIVRSDELAEATKRLGTSLNDLLPGLEASARAAASQLTETPQFLQTAIAREQAPGGSPEGQLEALRQAQEELERQEQAIRELPLAQAEINAALEAVFGEQANIAGQIEQLTKEVRPDILEPLVEAVNDARLSGSNQKILAALKREQAVLEQQIAAQKTSAADRRRFKTELVNVNRDIEATQDEIVAEAQRHQQAMLDKILDIGVLEDLESQAQGGSSTAGRARRAAAIQATLDRGTLNGKRLTRDQKEQLNAELVAINAAIESEYDAAVAEAERHANEVERAQNEHDQAVIDGLQGPQRRARNRQLQAAATAALADDIAASERLQRVYREQVAVARRRIQDQKLRDATIAGLEDQIVAEQRNERSLRQQARRERIDRREESLDLDIQLAQANENLVAERRAHEAKVRFLQERITHTRRNTNQRKQLRLEIARERAEIRRINEELGDTAGDGAQFKELAFAFLQELQGFSSNLASNVLPGGFSLPPNRTTAPPTSLRRPPLSNLPDDPNRDPFAFTPSPFEQGKGGKRPDGKAALDLRESGGGNATAGQMETLINVGRTTNRLLGDIKRGVGHTEAKTARDLNRYRGGTVDVM